MTDNFVTALGGGSGIDTKKLVSQLVEIERAAPQQRLDDRTELLQSQLSDFGILRSAISTVEDALTILGDPDTFNAKSLAIPDTNLITPTSLDADAITGDFQIEIDQVARAQSLTSTTFASISDPVGEGTLTFRFGSFDDGLTAFTVDAEKVGATITIDASNNSLGGLRDAINDADFGVQASVVNNGSGFVLLLTAPSGATNELEIVVSEAGGTPSNNDANDLSRFAFNTGGFQLTEQRSGLDAQLKINGLSVTRESNVVDDVIQGLSFTINNESATEKVNLTITEDRSIARQTVTDFVDTFNEFLDTVDTLVGFNDELGDFGSLRNDSLTKNLVNRFRSVISASVPGVQNGFNALTNVGIRTERDGSLSIDQDDFDDAFDNNFDLIKSIFTPQTSSDSSLIQVTGFSELSTPGSFSVNISNTATAGTLITDPIVAGFPFNTGANDYSFNITVDGVASGTITLPAATDFATEADLATELQSLINNDTTLAANSKSVTVEFVTDHFEFTSDNVGVNSNVSITSVGANAGDLGLLVKSGTAGTNVAGTIDGKAGFGLGAVLLPALGSDAEGLSLLVATGATTGTINFSRGFAGELAQVIDDFLARSGLIGQRETAIREDLDDIDDDQVELDRRIDAFEARLQAQFIASERIIATLQSAGGFFEGLSDRLPFTSGN